MSSNHLHINRLRLHNPAGNEVALRMGVEQALRQVRLMPGRLPPGAVLIIRHLQSRQSIGPGPADKRRWQQHVQSEIEALSRLALRPARQHVLPNTRSVLFLDEVELLVCYTRDVLARRTNWYWTNIFPQDAYPGRPAGEQLLAGWQSFAHALPDTLVELKPLEARGALNCMSHSQISILAHLLHRTFTLPDDLLKVTVPDSITADSSALSGQAADQPMGLPAAPWREWLPSEFDEDLDCRAGYIIGLCYTLARRPGLARQEHFWLAAKDWLVSRQMNADRTQQPLDGHSRPMLDGDSQRELEIEARQAGEDGTQRNGESRTRQHMFEEPLHESRPARSLTAGVEQDDLQTAVTPEEGSRFGAPFTRLGGAFFVINLLELLKLPAVFPALAGLNPWELLGAVTADLLGDLLSEYVDDPLWSAINDLAGLEPGERWGKALAEPVEFHLPPEWLADLANETISCRLERQDGRLRLRHQSSDLLIADLPDEEGHLDNLAAAYGALQIEPADSSDASAQQANGYQRENKALSELCAPNLIWYVVRMRPFLTDFLHHLTRETIESIMHQPAELYCSRTHVDLCMSLEQISIPLRRAGLDQTPGWLPDYGYIVTIYFE